MWRLAFPFFVAQLMGAYTVTALHLLVFRLGSKKFLVINLSLTALLGVLLWLFLWLPNSKGPTIPELGLSLPLSQEIIPKPFVIERAKLGEALGKYKQAVQSQAFISQADYINLAVLSQAAGEYQSAIQYLKLARYIDPNREFFTE